jgi:hypothetical protein
MVGRHLPGYYDVMIEWLKRRVKTRVECYLRCKLSLPLDALIDDKTVFIIKRS